MFRSFQQQNQKIDIFPEDSLFRQTSLLRAGTARKQNEPRTKSPPPLPTYSATPPPPPSPLRL